MSNNQANPQANIGVVGLAVMGANLARNLASREGNRVAVMNRSPERTRALVAAHPEALFIAAETVADFAASLRRPRTAIIMVQAGAATDEVIQDLAAAFEPGDIIIDGGNALYTETIRREFDLRERGLHFVGAGISGGEVGALNGPSIMPGGSTEAYAVVGPIFESIAARASDGDACVTHIGSDGSGHFVKMVHNGIEYADMQLIAETFDVLRNIGGLTPAEIADVFDEWNAGELESYLVEITALVLRHRDARTGRPFVDVVLDQAGQKGTGGWTVQTALTLGTPISSIAEAVFARGLSAHPEQRLLGAHLRGPSAKPVIEDRDAFVESVRQALYASKIIAYSQGFDVIRAGAEQYGWAIDSAKIAKIWREGCIIRARFLGHIAEAYGADPSLDSLVTAPFFASAAGAAQDAWRSVVSAAALAGVPIPAFASSLAYYDGLRAARLPADLIQAQRDFFGAHSYRRVDGPGVFHTEWSGDGSETQLLG
jgi:6-phosphogluconate dehydrogenase